MPEQGKLMPEGVEVTKGEVGTTPDEGVTSGLQMIDQGLRLVFGALGSDLPTKEVEVKAGDTLWKLANEHLGNGQRWREIYLLNLAATMQESTSRGVTPNADFIFPGTKLKLLAF